MNKEEIEIINFNNYREEYKINKIKVVKKENIERLFVNQIEDKIVINAEIIERFFIIISVKLKNPLDLNNQNSKEIKLNSFNITIIKFDTNNNQQININIPIKGEINISTKEFFNNKFYFFDLAMIDDGKAYFFLYIFNQLHFFKLYQKEEQLKYNKIKIKNFSNETTILYIGKNYLKDKNILEVELLLKPNNYFCHISIDITNETKKIEDVEYKIDKEEYKNRLNKFIRSNCGLFVFSGKKNNNKYIVSTEENKKEIVFRELNINNVSKESNVNLKIICLYNILEKIFIIIDITKEEEENEYKKYGIYNALFNEKENNYILELMQQLNIKNEEGIKNYNFNINISNIISFNLGKKLYFIHLDQNGFVDTINMILIDSKELNIQKFFYDKSKELSLLILFINNNIYISKFFDEFDKNEKYISNGNKFENKEDKNNRILTGNNQKVKDESINCISSENNEQTKINSIENENNQLMDDVKNKIEKIILDRIEFNKYTLTKSIDEKSRKINSLNKDIKFEKEENRKLKNKYDNIKIIINSLQKMKNENNIFINEEQGDEEDPKFNHFGYNYNQDYNNNNYYQYNENQNYNNQIKLMNRMSNLQQQNINYNYQNYPYNINQINPQIMNQLYQQKQIHS